MDHLVIACGICGGDPVTDGMLVQTAIAAGITAPVMLRRQVLDFVRRIVGRSQEPPSEPVVCRRAEADEDSPRR